MRCAQHSTALLQHAKTALGPRHAHVTRAHARIAHVMTLSAAERSCANALPLWRSVLAATKACVPPNWPHLLVPLRGGVDAARGCNDAEALASFQVGLEAVLQVLRPKCDDIM